MSVLVIAEHDNKNLKSSTLNTISAAEKLSEDIHLLILGTTIEDLAKQLTESAQNNASEDIIEESLENITETLDETPEEDK